MGLLIIGGFEFPDSCPENCRFKGDIGKYGQGSICVSCPIFCCAGENPPLGPPEEYRKDWAEVWFNWFKSDMVQEPVLCLFREEDERRNDNCC